MNHQPLVARIFKEIENAESVEDLQLICEDPAIANNLIAQSKYPRIKFILSKQEIESLIDSQRIDNSNHRLSGNFVPETPMEKLLYSVIWKQGDISKIGKIVEGIKGSQNTGDKVVFYYFGRHLADKNNPIIDQHVIRAFKCYKCHVDACNLKILSRKLNDEDISKYIDWIGKVKIVEKISGSVKDDAIYIIDKILFALGKTIKA